MSALARCYFVQRVFAAVLILRIYVVCIIVLYTYVCAEPEDGKESIPGIKKQRQTVENT